MKMFVKYGIISLLAGAAVGLTDCSGNQTTTAQAPGSDPATANIAPAGAPDTYQQPAYQQSSPQPAQQQTAAANYAPAPGPASGYDNGSAPAQSFDASYTENDQQYAQDQEAFGDQPMQTTEAPPP